MNQFQALSQMREGFHDLFSLAKKHLKSSYNISIFDQNLDDHLCLNAVVVPQEVFENKRLTIRIEEYIRTTFLKYHLRIISGSWKAREEYKVQWCGTNYTSFHIHHHYSFEVIPYYSIRYSEVIMIQDVFRDYKGWEVQTLQLLPNEWHVYASTANVEEMD
jgi:hypothetical protein